MREAHKSRAIILLWHNNREQKEHQRLSSEQNRAPSEEKCNLSVNTSAWTSGPLLRHTRQRMCVSVSIRATVHIHFDYIIAQCATRAIQVEVLKQDFEIPRVHQGSSLTL